MAEIIKTKEFQLSIMLISFLIVFIPYFIDIPALDTVSTKLITIAALVNIFTIALAVYSLIKRSTNFIQRKPRGWYFKAYMLFTMGLMLVFSMFGLESGPYHWVMFAVVNPLSSVNYGILAFYMASTCARAFKARNTKASLLLITGVIVLLYQAPLTGTIFPGIEPVALYLTDTFGKAAGKMFLISVTVGALVFGVRVLLGNEPSVLGIGGDE
jgi:hypothetical protein